MNIIKIAATATLLLLANIASAITIDRTTHQINEKKDRVIATVTNEDSSRAHIYTVRVDRVESPYDLTPISGNFKDELLYTPTRLIMPSKGINRFTFIYKGPADDKERYYRIVWQDQALEAGKTKAESEKITAEASTTISLQTVLLVAPRKASFAYSFDGKRFTNTGNISVNVNGYGPCKNTYTGGKQSFCNHDSWVAPGKSATFNSINSNSNQLSLGIWKDKQFIQLTRTVGSVSIK